MHKVGRSIPAAGILILAFSAAAPAATVAAPRAPGRSASSPGPTATPTKKPERSPTLKQLLVLLMTHPTEKHDADPGRIDFILRTGEFKVPSQRGRPVNEKEPKTYDVLRASLALVDRPPFALSPEQIGPEDSLVLSVYTASSGHLHWHMEDKGAKGPASGGTDAAVPFFGRETSSIYRGYLDLILASLKSGAKAKE